MRITAIKAMRITTRTTVRIAPIRRTRITTITTAMVAPIATASIAKQQQREKQK